MRRLVSSAALLGLLFALAPVAVASPSADGGDRAAARGRSRSPRRRSRSVGFPWRGRLEHGVALRESRTVRIVPEYAGRGHQFGTWQLVQLLERAAERVEQRLPGARLSVGEISAEAGGHLDGHRSHQSGRDADVGFYMTDARGRPYEGIAFAEFGADGVGLGGNRMLRFDDARNWELVGKLVADGDARVQHIFVSNALERRLLREGRRRRAPQTVLDRAARVMSQPGHHPHRNHFHVRVYCNPAERGACRDRAPFHSWYPGRPPHQGS
ncbi:MAG: penicillin-insensitive murein endopeptidase [Sandaracinaceae bacterium]|nr:penicillin-insensitive murein endopeptidase [Sandaracinaceae bacterium]